MGQGFHDYQKLYAFGINWDPDQFREKACFGLRGIRREIHRQKEWRNELEKMKMSQVTLL